MENKMQLLENEEFSLSMELIDGRPWFLARDVAKALGYADTDQAVRAHVDMEDKLTRAFHGSGQGRKMILINESGVYALILSSRKDSARRFKRWVTSEVLPSIRSFGAYLDPATLETLKQHPDLLETLTEDLHEAQLDNHVLQRRLSEAIPKADYFDAFIGSGPQQQFTCLRNTAKELGIPEKHFIRYLQAHHYLYRCSGTLLPYAEATRSGLFNVREYYYGRNKVKYQTMVTPKGKLLFHRHLEQIIAWEDSE